VNCDSAHNPLVGSEPPFKILFKTDGIGRFDLALPAYRVRRFAGEFFLSLLW
jgi:hypothetical protein